MIVQKHEEYRSSKVGVLVYEIVFEREEIGYSLVKCRPDLLFRSNAEGLLIGINETAEQENGLAPILYICYGSGLLVFRHRLDIPKAWLEKLNSCIKRINPMINRPAGELESMVRWATHSTGNAIRVESGPAYYIPRKPAVDSEVIEVGPENCGVLEPDFRYTLEHITDLRPCFAKIIQGKAVAVCRTVRRTSLALEAGVDTIPEFRGRGFGTETVIAWASQVWSEERVPCYSTGWENKASLTLAGKVGMIQYATDIAVPEQ